MLNTIEEYRAKLNQGFREFVDANCVTKDFPIEGVNFIDIFPIIKRYNLHEFTEVFIFPEALILVPEARGFLFAAEMEWSKVVPMRKKGKLPGELLEISYQKEYGVDKLYVQKSCIINQLESIGWDKNKPVPVCFFDDVLATGGTAKAVTEFFNNLELDGYTFEVVSNKFYLEIVELHGRDILENITSKSGKQLKVKTIYEY